MLRGITAGLDDTNLRVVFDGAFAGRLEDESRPSSSIANELPDAGRMDGFADRANRLGDCPTVDIEDWAEVRPCA